VKRLEKRIVPDKILNTPVKVKCSIPYSYCFGDLEKTMETLAYGSRYHIISRSLNSIKLDKVHGQFFLLIIILRFGKQKRIPPTSVARSTINDVFFSV